MQVNVTARHTEVTEDLRNYIVEKVQRLQKYFDRITDAHVILNVEKYRAIAEVTLEASGTRINGKEEAGDLYAAIDLVIDRLKRQTRRYKEKLRTKYRNHRQKKIAPENVIASVNPKIKGGEVMLLAEVKKYDTKPITLKQAIKKLEALKYEYLAFINSSNKQVNIIYRLNNGNYGLMEPNI